MWKPRKKILDVMSYAGAASILGGSWIVGIGCGLIVSGVMLITLCAYHREDEVVGVNNGRSESGNIELS